jgi:hypothetical protein
MAPCGDAWALMRPAVGDVFYQDDVHPTKFGQYINSCVFYATITGKSPVGLGDAGTGFGSSYNLTMLQDYAWRAYLTFKANQTANCTYDLCARFVEADGSLSAVPTSPPTTAAPPTTAYDLPYCGQPDAMNEALIASSLLSEAQSAALSDRLRLFCPAMWAICFHSSGYYATPADFHHNCNDRGPTVVVVQAGGRLFGGFTSLNWTTNDQSGLRAPGAFLFRAGTDGLLDFQSIDTPDMTVKNMYDSPLACPMLGVQADLNLGDCTYVPTFNPYPNYPNANPNYELVV